MTKARGSVSADTKLAILSLINFLLFIPWYQLRTAHDAGNDYPVIVIGLAALTIWTWSQLVMFVIARFRHFSKHPNGGGTE